VVYAEGEARRSGDDHILAERRAGAELFELCDLERGDAGVFREDSGGGGQEPGVGLLVLGRD